MGEVSLRHKVVCLENLLDIAALDTQSDTHDHVLRSLDNLAVDSEEVRPLERLEAEVVVRKVTVVNDGRVKDVLVVHDDLKHVIGDHRSMLVSLWVDPVVEIGHDGGEGLFRLLVQVGNGNTGGEDGIVGVFGRKIRSGLSGEILPVSDVKQIHSHPARLS